MKHSRSDERDCGNKVLLGQRIFEGEVKYE